MAYKAVILLKNGVLCWYGEFWGWFLEGAIIYWSREYIDSFIDKGERISVVYGGHSTQLPSLKKIKKGDTVYPVTLYKNDLCVLGRLTIENIETAFDCLMRETGKPYDCIFPDVYAVRCTYNDAPYIPRDKAGKHFYPTNKQKYETAEELPENTKVMILEELTDKPHRASQEPPAMLAAFALSGSKGSEILMRVIPPEKLPELRFGTGKEQKPLKTDRNGRIVIASVLGNARLMSDETREYFDLLFMEV